MVLTKPNYFTTNIYQEDNFIVDNFPIPYCTRFIQRKKTLTFEMECLPNHLICYIFLKLRHTLIIRRFTSQTSMTYSLGIEIGSEPSFTLDILFPIRSSISQQMDSDFCWMVKPYKVRETPIKETNNSEWEVG